MHQFNFNDYITSFLSKKQNIFLISMGLLLTANSYLKSIVIPLRLNNMVLSGKNIIIFNLILLVYIIFDYIYTMNMQKLMFNLHQFSYKYISCKLLDIKIDNLDKEINSSTYTSMVRLVDNITWVLVNTFTLIPFIVSIILILFYVKNNISFGKSIILLLSIIIQILIGFYFSGDLNKLAQHFSKMRNNLIEKTYDININMGQIVSTNSVDQEKKNILSFIKSFMKLKTEYYIKQRHFIYSIILINYIIYIFFSLSISDPLILKNFLLIYLFFLFSLFSELDKIVLFISFTAATVIDYNNIKSNINNLIKYKGPKNNKKLNSLYINDIKVRYGNKIIYNNFNYEFDLNKTYAIIGKIGSGKSTLLKMLFGMIKIEEGDIFYKELNLNNTSLMTWRHHFNYIKQNDKLFDRSLKENIFYPYNDITPEFKEILKELKIYNFISDLINRDQKKTIVSSGQTQLILLIRLLFKRSSIILLDEPTSALDHNSKLIAIRIINYLKEKGCTIIIVTHDNILMEVVDTVINIEDYCTN
jgi:ATP-binding cassette, subfamily B, bacterial